MTPRPVRPIGVLAACLVLMAGRPVNAQPLVDVLSFLMTNRSIATGDFVRDERAASATSDAIAGLLASELATLPVNSSAGGFTYRLNPAIGSSVRASESFGPLFTERSLTLGRFRRAVGVSQQSATYLNVDGRALRDGTLVSTAARLQADPEPFDIETLSLRLHTDIVTLSGMIGLSARLDVGASLPLVRVTLSGQRVDTYRGESFVQAAGSGTAAGIGDVVLRAKYRARGEQATGIAVGVEGRLPTGDEDNLLGAGRASVRPIAIASFESARIGAHTNVGYSLGGLARELNFSAAVAVAATPRVTGFSEIAGRRLSSSGRLTSIVEPHPTLVGVDTIRLTAVDEGTSRVVTVFGVKWNLTGSFLVGGSVLKPLTDAGLNAGWVPTFIFDYSFGR
jgi:hypothetical protein